MSDKDPIKDLFREKLQSHEVMPSEAVWSNVSSSLGHSAASASGLGASSILKIAAVAVGVTTAGVASYFYFNSEESSPKVTEKIVLQEEVLDEPLSSETLEVEQKDKSSSEPIIQSETPTISNRQISEVKDQESQPDLTAQESLPVSIPSEKQADFDVQENTITENIITSPSSLEETEPVEENVSLVNNVLETPEVLEQEIIQALESDEAVLPAEENIVLPNIFTPNGDRVNDLFSIEMSEKSEFQIIVLDAKNQIVFKSNDSNFEWDGTMLSGAPAPAGNYLYYFSAKDMAGNDVTKSSLLKIQR
ncbi:MAG: gliding motility-associated C-terminal domain-containing protein [Crocinitomicaceae bacterium]|nr:gliding motility-associated C-terminal domain-containing protein [Crocinitomicaceae bacterium]